MWVLRVAGVLLALVIYLWWGVDVAVSTFGPLSIYELWHREAHFFALSYGWFVAARIIVVLPATFVVAQIKSKAW